MLPLTPPELSDDQIAQIEQARKAIPLVRKELSKAKLAGIDVSVQEAELNDTEQKLDKLYRVYVRRLSGTP